MVDSAVVLGPGGPAGTAWMAGLAEGLRREGVDLGAADLIVGTSAGAIVGAILASGGDLARLAALPAPADPGDRVRTDPDMPAAPLPPRKARRCAAALPAIHARKFQQCRR
jgi:NTE family protein